MTTLICPHCQEELSCPVPDHINVGQEPDLRRSVKELSCFRVRCQNCGETMLVVQPCLYHDPDNRFMVWLWPEQEKGLVPKAAFDPLAGYTLRQVEHLNAFREKISILELGLDDRAVEMTKLLLYWQLRHDLDVVELVFHELDRQTGAFRFAAVLSDGAEQYVAMPGETYLRLQEDVAAYFGTAPGDFLKIDMAWAANALELLHTLM